MPDLLRCSAAHALVDGVVLGVDGEERYIVLFCRGDNEFAGGDEALLVGEADGFARADCRVGGFEAGYADDRGDDKIYFGKCGDMDAAVGSVDYFNAGDACLFEAGCEGGGELFGCERDDFGAPAETLLEGHVDVAAGGERDYLVAVGEGLADGKGAVADGAGRAEDC